MKKLDNCDFIDSARIKLFSNCYILDRDLWDYWDLWDNTGSISQ
jgi:hypothetical protein